MNLNNLKKALIMAVAVIGFWFYTIVEANAHDALFACWQVEYHMRQIEANTSRINTLESKGLYRTFGDSETIDRLNDEVRQHAFEVYWYSNGGCNVSV